MKKILLLWSLLHLAYPSKFLLAATDSNLVAGRNFGYKNAIGPVYAFNNVGHNIGILYERTLDRKGVIAVKGGIYYGWYQYGNYYDNNANSAVFQTGIKVFPSVLGKTFQFVTGLDISYAKGKVLDNPPNNLVARTALSCLIHTDLMLNIDKSTYFFLSYGAGIMFTTLDQRDYLFALDNHILTSVQLAAGLRFRF